VTVYLHYYKTLKHALLLQRKRGKYWDVAHLIGLPFHLFQFVSKQMKLQAQHCPG